MRKTFKATEKLHDVCSHMADRYERDSIRDKFWTYFANRLSKRLCKRGWGEEIHVAKCFSRFPTGNINKDGVFCGENFRTQHLIPSLLLHDKVTVVLDGTMGYGSGWLKEAFGKLTKDFTIKELESILTIVSKEDPSLAVEAWMYIRG